MGKNHKRRDPNNTDADGNHRAKTARLKREIALHDNNVAPQQVYLIDNAARLRRVSPYWFTHRSMAKGRWLNRSLFDVFCKEFHDRDASYYARAIETGMIAVNNRPASPDYVIKNGDMICHSMHRHEPPVSSAKIKIIYQDTETLIIDKPASIPVHPSGRFNHNSVVSLLKSAEYGFSEIFSINRLDRLTSGILLLALTKQKAAVLAAELAKRTVSKTYLARVRGHFTPHTVTCTQPILIASSKLGVNVVDAASGRACETDFAFRSYNAASDTSVVECRPKTGRTHQIRVHLQYLGFPIANDPLYANADFWGPTLAKGGVAPEGGGVAAVVARIQAAKLHLFAEAGFCADDVPPIPSVIPLVDKVSNDGVKNLGDSETIVRAAGNGNDSSNALNTDSVEKPKTGNVLVSSTSTGPIVAIQSADHQPRTIEPKIATKDLIGDAPTLPSADIVASVTSTAPETSPPGAPEKIPTAIPGVYMDADKFPCRECRANGLDDPLRSQLRIYLHSWKYSGDGWSYETELPDWADPDFVE